MNKFATAALIVLVGVGAAHAESDLPTCESVVLACCHSPGSDAWTPPDCHQTLVCLFGSRPMAINMKTCCEAVARGEKQCKNELPY